MARGDQWPWNTYPPYMPGPETTARNPFFSEPFIYKTPTPRARVAVAPDLGKQLAAALGFDGKMVRSIDLHVAVDDVVTAKVEVIVTESQAVEIRDIFTKRVKLESKVVGEEIVDE
jgi:hypothetical protein